MTFQVAIKRSKKLRRADRKAQSIAAAAEIWEPREGKERPTPERRAKGAFVLRDTEDAGVTVAVDEGATELDRLALRGTITEDQRQAGHDLAQVLHRTRLTSSGRSCIDMTPVGHQSLEDSDDDWQAKRDEQQRQAVYLRCRGPWVWPELIRVCRDDEPVRDVASLRSGLDVAMKVFGR